eukprot:1348308-Rhodomonas_salina.3
MMMMMGESAEEDEKEDVEEDVHKPKQKFRANTQTRFQRGLGSSLVVQGREVPGSHVAVSWPRFLGQIQAD